VDYALHFGDLLKEAEGSPPDVRSVGAGNDTRQKRFIGAILAIPISLYVAEFIT